MKSLNIHAVCDGQTAAVWELAQNEGPRDVGSSLQAHWILDDCPDLLCRLEVVGEAGDRLSVTELGQAKILVNGVDVGFRAELCNGKQPVCTVGRWQFVVTADPPNVGDDLHVADQLKAASLAAPTAGVAEVTAPIRSLALKIREGRKVEIVEATPGMTFGRDEGCSRRFAHAHVSRIHAAIGDATEGIVIRDLGSKHHTYVNGEPLDKGETALLKPGAVIELSRAFGAPRLEVLARADVSVEKAKADADASLVGDSVEFNEQIELVMQFTRGTDPILLLGERGTGKSALARAAAAAWRPGRPFVTFDCGSVPATLIESELFGHTDGAFTGAKARKGLVQMANGGVLFIDEIGEMPLALQTRLLRVLNDKVIRALGSEVDTAVDVCVVLATNRDITEMKDADLFRPDLFDRFGRRIARMLSLREHKSDIPAIANGHLARRKGEERLVLSEDAEALLCSFDWPGNVRELLSVVEAAALHGRGGYVDAAAIQAVLRQVEKALSKPPPLVRQASPNSEPAERAIAIEALRCLDEGGPVDAQAAGLAVERAIVAAAIARSGGKWRQTLWEELGYESHHALFRRLKKWRLLPEAGDPKTE